MYLQDVESVFDLVYTDTMSYRDVFFQNEVEQSKYAFEHSNAPKLFEQFAFFESEAKRLLEAKLPLPGYEMILKAAHTFNLLDARGAISVTERAAYIGRIRNALAARRDRVCRVARGAGFPDAAAGACEGDGMTNATLVVELVTEELPPKALKRLGEAFADGIVAGLRQRGFLDDESAGHRVRDAPSAGGVDHPRAVGRARRRGGRQADAGEGGPRRNRSCRPKR